MSGGELILKLIKELIKVAQRFSLYIDVLRVLYVAACAKLFLPHSPVPCYPAQASKVAGHFWSPMAQMACKLVSSCVFVKFKFCQILGPKKPVFGPKIGKIPNPACVSKEAAVKLSSCQLSRYKLSAVKLSSCQAVKLSAVKV